MPLGSCTFTCGRGSDGRNATSKAMRTRGYQHIQEDGCPHGGHFFVRGGFGGVEAMGTTRPGIFGLAASMPSRTTSG